MWVSVFRNREIHWCMSSGAPRWGNWQSSQWRRQLDGLRRWRQERGDFEPWTLFSTWFYPASSPWLKTLNDGIARAIAEVDTVDDWRRSYRFAYIPRFGFGGDKNWCWTAGQKDVSSSRDWIIIAELLVTDVDQETLERPQQWSSLLFWSG